MSDTLVLGGVVFDPFSTPVEIPFGGRQAMVVHKLPGGARVIDTLGPDEANIDWSGFFYGDNAMDIAVQLDGMRASGSVYPLTFCGQYRSVIIESFIPKVRKFPYWVNYTISCMVYQNPSLGTLGAISGSIDSLILSDLSVALGAIQ